MNKVVEYIIRAKDATGAGIKSALGRITGFAAGVGRSLTRIQSGLQTGIKSTLGQITGFAAGVGRNLANVQAGLQMAMGAVRTFASVFTKSIGEAFKFEKAVTDFKVLLGSVKSARNHIADLKKFAASTPLTFGDLSRASKLLLSFGSSVDEVMPSLKTLGDIAMGDAQKFQGLALVFAQVKSQGKLMGQDLLQMINQGFNPLTVISKETGKSMSELKDMMSEGKISFEMVAEAMRLATSEGGLFNNAMKEASQTGEGLLSTLEDNWIDALRAFGEELTTVAKGGIQWCINKLQELKESGKIQEWAEKAKKAIYTVIGAFNGLSDASTRAETWTAIKDVVIGGFEEAAKKAIELLKGAAPIIGALIGQGFGSLKDFFADMMSESAAKQAAKDQLGDSIYEWKEEVSAPGIGMPGAMTQMVKKRVLKDGAQEQIDALAQDILAEMKRQKVAEVKTAAAEMSGLFADSDTEESRFDRGIKALSKLGAMVAESANNLNNMPKEPPPKPKGKSISEMVSDANSDDRQKEAERAAKAAAKAAAEEEKKERLRVEREIAAKRKELREAEFRESAAQSRLDIARSASARAWGWYRDKDSLKAQLEEERAEAAAQAQFEKDFEKLRSRSDWRTAAAYGSGKMRALTLDEEATRRVALAREEERAAEEYAKQTAAECKRSADALAALQKTICEEG